MLLFFFVQILMEKYQKIVAEQPIVFEEDKIELMIPNDGLTLDGWTIQPLVAPVVSNYVHSKSIDI